MYAGQTVSSPRGARQDPAADRQVERTKQALRDALLGMMSEVGYERASVAGIAARANVGRSTFYAHFIDKEDLLLHGIEQLRQMLRTFVRPPEAAPCAHPALAFALPMFLHVGEHLHLARGLAGRKAEGSVRGHMHRCYRALVVEQLEATTSGNGEDVPFLSHFLVGAFQGTLDAWVADSDRCDALHLDARFQELGGPVLGRAGFVLEPSG